MVAFTDVAYLAQTAAAAAYSNMQQPIIQLLLQLYYTARLVYTALGLSKPVAATVLQLEVFPPEVQH
jgi:hypothetical protein